MNASATLAPAPAPDRVSGARLAWLDALRGIAALVVVYEHMIDPVFPELRGVSSPWFDAGIYGVMVFFLVSGYVVPASLERMGSVRDFWIGRVFRLYPLWAVAVSAAVLLGVTGIDPMHAWLTDRPVTAAVAHATMLQDLLNVPNISNVLWTLSYEMVFYVLVTAMYVAGVHGRSTETAVGLGVIALLAGGVLPSALLSQGEANQRAVALAVAVLLGGGLTAVLSGQGRVRQGGAAALAVVACGLLAINGRVPAWQSLIILATMFAGTALYRAENRLPPLVLIVPIAALLVGLWHGAGVPWALAIMAAWATFAVGMALRHRRIPGLLAWLGLISYSVYLLHPVLLEVVDGLVASPESIPLVIRLGLGLAVLACLLAASAATYRHVEAPMQRLGRKIIKRRV